MTSTTGTDGEQRSPKTASRPYKKLHAASVTHAVCRGQSPKFCLGFGYKHHRLAAVHQLGSRAAMLHASSTTIPTPARSRECATMRSDLHAAGLRCGRKSITSPGGQHMKGRSGCLHTEGTMSGRRVTPCIAGEAGRQGHVTDTHTLTQSNKEGNGQNGHTWGHGGTTITTARCGGGPCCQSPASCPCACT